jgi:ketosteroid isomerase-like protein
MRWMARFAFLSLLASTVVAAGGSGPGEFVAAERAFAHHADTATVRAAFLAHLAPASIVFNPDPEDGIKAYEARKPNGTRLAWQPAYAMSSGDGDMGWTTGPWQWRRDASRPAPEITGDYLTVWKRQPDGTLKVVLDAGIPHPAPPEGTPAPEPETHALAGTPGARGPLAERKALWKADADFARTSGAQGRPAALAAMGAEDLRLMLPGRFPILGRDAARDTVTAQAAHETLMSTGQFIADSGDLGYTFGTLVATRDAGPDSSYYIHVWKREGAKPWQLAVELLVPKK